MISIDNIIKKELIGIVLFLSSILSIHAQDYQVRASAPSNVGVGQQFNLTYTCTEKATINLPNIKDFSLLGGPQVSSSSSVEIINGRMSQSSSYSYTYVLQAVKEGDYEIPSAVAVINGKNIRSNSVKVHVGAASSQNQQGQRGNQRQSASNQPISKNDFFIKAVVSNSNPYIEEQTIIQYKLYLPSQVQRYQASIKKSPSSTGFWTYELSDKNAEPPRSTETVNGKQYTVIDLYSMAVYPQKSGKLTISPLEIQTVVQVVVQQQQRSNDFWDNFFNDPFFGGGRIQNLELAIASNPVTITVKELPKNAPADFSGLVGDFKISTGLTRNTLSTNDATNFTITISGRGNLQHIEAPNIVFPSDFEVQEPNISDNIQKNAQGIYGSRTFEYVIIPRNPGDFIIPQTSFIFYDKNKKQFVSLYSNKLTLKVTKGKESQNQLYTSSNKKNVQIIGSDIRFIKTNGSVLEKDTVFVKSPFYWLIFGLPFILFVLFLILWRKQIKQRQNAVLAKDKKASKLARKRLQTAEKFLKTNNQEQFYIEISKALWGYISDKFHIPLVQLSLDTARNKLEERNMEAEYIDEFLSVLNLCEYVRFAPGSDLTSQKMYETAFEFITKIERALKKNSTV